MGLTGNLVETSMTRIPFLAISKILHNKTWQYGMSHQEGGHFVQPMEPLQSFVKLGDTLERLGNNRRLVERQCCSRQKKWSFFSFFFFFYSISRPGTSHPRGLVVAKVKASCRTVAGDWSWSWMPPSEQLTGIFSPRLPAAR